MNLNAKQVVILFILNTWPKCIHRYIYMFFCTLYIIIDRLTDFLDNYWYLDRNLKQPRH